MYSKTTMLSKQGSLCYSLFEKDTDKVFGLPEIVLVLNNFVRCFKECEWKEKKQKGSLMAPLQKRSLALTYSHTGLPPHYHRPRTA